MLDIEKLFSLTQADDAAGLDAALEGYDAHRVRNENGETLFLFSLFRGRTKCVELLRKRGSLTLHEAAAAGDTSRIRECAIAAPWSIQTLSADGWPALHLAAFLGCDDALECLLEHGADPLQWARAVESNLAIHAAAAGRRIGRNAMMKLAKATGNPDRLQKQGYTALMIAAANGFELAVDVLLEAGADRDLKLADGRSARDIARERGQAALAERI